MSFETRLYSDTTNNNDDHDDDDDNNKITLVSRRISAFTGKSVFVNNGNLTPPLERRSCIINLSYEIRWKIQRRPLLKYTPFDTFIRIYKNNNDDNKNR